MQSLGQQNVVDFATNLNEAQRSAVEALDGPLLVLAGAGTGKTRVLTSRIANLIAQNKCRPDSILAVTFTNKAAREMKERLGKMMGGVVEGMPWLGTFHAVGTKFLRRHAELVGLKSNFTILDTDDQLRLLKQLIRADGLDDKRWPPRQLAGLIDQWKNRGLTPEKVPPSEGALYAGNKGIALYKAYQARLRELNACDFGDLLLHVFAVLSQHNEVLEKYQRIFQYILVDEYQDTNVIQYLILRLLAQKNKNICCVGDDDQAIYGWRGAEVDNILRFEHDFPGAKVVRLENNYRSTGHILSSASHLITHNADRLGKTLFTHSGDGEKPKLSSTWDSEEEARLVSSEIEDAHKNGANLDEIAILVRASFQMREFEDRFVTLGLPYRVIGGPRFYERAEIRDAMAYLRCVHSPSDDLAFERIFNTPKRGLGDATLKMLYESARALHVPLMQAAEMLVTTEDLKPKARGTLQFLMSQFQEWRSLIDTLPHAELTERILDESGYTQMWQNEKTPEAAGRLENLKEFVRSMEEFPSLDAFLEHVSLVMDAERNDGGAKVSIMTLHAAKGLEFERVFLPGWEEGLFPHQRALDEQGRAGLEEERRLAYVGITRAKRKLHISFAANRRIHGLWQASVPSRFINELPDAHIDVMSDPQVSQGYTPSRFDQNKSFSGGYSSPGWQRAASAPKTIEGKVISSGFSGGIGKFALGDRVFHVKFGMGNVAACSGDKATIDFDKAGRKVVLASFLEKS